VKYSRVFCFLLVFTPALSWGNCLVTGLSLSFGTYEPFVAIPSDSNGLVEVLCDLNLSYQVTLDAGLNSQGSVITRQLRDASGNSSLLYNLYLDPSFTLIWGTGEAGSEVFNGIGGGSSMQIPVYGRIPGRQNVAPGVYTDNVVITVAW